MPRKQPFPPEADTQPDIQRPSGPAPKSKRARTEAPTVPPPPRSKRKGEGGPSVAASTAKAIDTRTSGIRSRKPPPPSTAPRKKGRDDDAQRPGAAVDEVTADLSRDPRRDSDDD